MQQLKIFIIHPSDRLTDHLPDGDGLVAYGYIKHLADRGHMIYIAAKTYSLAKPMPENVKIFKLKQWIRLPVLDRIEYTLRARLLFEALNKNVRFDLLQQMNPVFVGLSLAFVGCRAPVFLGTIVPRWPDDSDSLASQFPMFRKIIEWSRNTVMALQQRHASALLLTSTAAMNKVPEPDRVRSKIFSLPHGIDSQLFSPCRIPACGKNSYSILFMARLIKRKGIYVLLDAYTELLASLPAACLVIAGDGPESGEIARRVRNLGAPGKISLVGSVNRTTAIDLIRNATVFCLPSFGEPYATTVIEAMSCGKPIIATNSGGIPELMPTGGGILVPPGNFSALAAALRQVLENENLQSEMGAINRRHVEANLTWTAVVNRLESIYGAVLATRASKTLDQELV